MLDTNQCTEFVGIYFVSVLRHPFAKVTVCLTKLDDTLCIFGIEYKVLGTRHQVHAYIRSSNIHTSCTHCTYGAYRTHYILYSTDIRILEIGF